MKRVNLNYVDDGKNAEKFQRTLKCLSERFCLICIAKVYSLNAQSLNSSWLLADAVKHWTNKAHCNFRIVLFIWKDLRLKLQNFHSSERKHAAKALLTINIKHARNYAKLPKKVCNAAFYICIIYAVIPSALHKTHSHLCAFEYLHFHTNEQTFCWLFPSSLLPSFY